jgi:hypothetical protein
VVTDIAGVVSDCCTEPDDVFPGAEPAGVLVVVAEVWFVESFVASAICAGGGAGSNVLEDETASASSLESTFTSVNSF